MSNKQSKIEIDVTTDENALPTNINWKASDTGVENSDAKSMFLAFWDRNEQNTMRIDLWTKDMSVDEMKQFMHQTLLTLANTFERATNEHNICEDLRDYCAHFADKMQLRIGE